MPKQPKKQSKPKGKSKNNRPIPVDSDRKSVNMRKVSNGYVVSTYGERGEKTVIAKTRAEAKDAANKMLGI